MEKGSGQRRGGDRHGGGQVLRSPAAVPAGGDAGARSGAGDRARNAGWLGDAGGRVAAAGGRRDAQGSAERHPIYRPTKRRFRCRCTTGAAAIIKRILWQYGKPGGETVFDFCLGRGREGPRKFLGKWEGILQTDGYQAYDGVGGPKMVHVGCWAHARRKFVDAVKVNPQDAEAVKMVTRMDALFLVDRDARQQSADMRTSVWRMRREHARPWVDEIREACLTLSRQALPKSALGKAAAYTLNHVAEAAALFRLRRSRAVQQPGGELDAAGSAGPQELAACGQRTRPARR